MLRAFKHAARRLATFSCLGAGTAHAQNTPVVTLPDALNRISEEFSDISSLREIKDSRLPITDRKDARIIALSPGSGAVTVVRRRNTHVYETLTAQNGNPVETVTSTSKWPTIVQRFVRPVRLTAASV